MKVSLYVHHLLNKHFLTRYGMFASLKTICFNSDLELLVTWSHRWHLVYMHLSWWKKVMLLPIPINFLASSFQIHWIKLIFLHIFSRDPLGACWNVKALHTAQLLSKGFTAGVVVLCVAVKAALSFAPCSLSPLSPCSLWCNRFHQLC